MTPKFKVGDLVEYVYSPASMDGDSTLRKMSVGLRETIGVGIVTEINVAVYASYRVWWTKLGSFSWRMEDGLGKVGKFCNDS